MANFSWLKSLGATPEAVAVLNDQPNLFANLVAVIIGLALQCLLIWFIHFATMKPEQKNKKKKKSKDNAKGNTAKR
ncbi:hypothetical protein CDD83_4033 [Cordyceps sp. RAO-2017]|nr:hypothetical protein CDD83_4033 [Cordyceps sp. RAO-2017]